MSLKPREMVCYLAIKHNGDWNKIYEGIQIKTLPEESVMIEALKTLKSNYITILDDEYPQQLRQVYKPPFVLFYYGNIELLKNDNIVSFVGSRTISAYSQGAIGEVLGKTYKNNVIMSKLSRGVGNITTQYAYENGMAQIVVMSSGIDNPYPYDLETRKLYDNIKEKPQALIISEFPNEVLADQNTCATTHRLLGSGLSKEMFVVQANERSGSLLAINYALSNSVEIVVLPQPYTSDSVNNNLIKDGADILLLAH